MGNLAYFPFYPADWLSSPEVTMSSYAEQGIYIRLLSYCWLSSTCSIPNEMSRLEALVGAPEQMFKPVLKFFTPHPSVEGCLTNERLMKEWLKARRSYDEKVKAGRKSGKSRRTKARTNNEQTANKTRTRVRNQNQSQNQSQNQRHKEEEGDCGGTPAASPATAEVVSPSVEAWLRYEAAYLIRWKTKPVRNGKVNAQLAKLVEYVGKDAAPELAAWYLTHNSPWYIKHRHPVWALLKDCESLHTQWKTGVKATTLEAKQAEFKDNLKGQYEQAMEILTQEESS